MKNSFTAFGSLLKNFEPLRQVAAWKRAAGPVFSKQAHFLGFRREQGVICLCLQVPDPIWRQELQFEADRLLQAYAEAWLAEGGSVHQLPKKLLLSAGPMPLKARNTQLKRPK